MFHPMNHDTVHPEGWNRLIKNGSALGFSAVSWVLVWAPLLYIHAKDLLLLLLFLGFNCLVYN